MIDKKAVIYVNVPIECRLSKTGKTIFLIAAIVSEYEKNIFMYGVLSD